MPLAIAAKNELLAKKDRVYCSTILDQKSCNAVPQCMYVNIDVGHIFKTQTDFSMCYDKRFLLTALKAGLYPENYSTVSDDTLAGDAGITEKLDFTKPESIAAVYNGLIQNKKVKYVTKFVVPAAAAA